MLPFCDLTRNCSQLRLFVHLQIILVNRDVDGMKTEAGLVFERISYLLGNVDMATQTGNSPAPNPHNYVLKGNVIN